MSEPFAITKEYQEKVLTLAHKNQKFCDLAALHLDAGLWSDKTLQYFFTKLCNGEYHHTDSTLQEELMSDISNDVISGAEVQSYVDVFKKIVGGNITPSEEDHVLNNFEKYAKKQAIKRALVEAVNLHKYDKWDEIEDVITKAVNINVDASTAGHDFFADFKSRLTDRMNEVQGKRSPVGISHLDDKYLNGGLGQGQLGLIVGATGRGKSVFLSHIAKTNVLLGEEVLVYSLELSEADYAKRFDAAFSQIPVNSLKKMNVELYHKLEAMYEKFKSKLIIKGFPTKSIGVKGLKAHTRSLRDKLKINPKLIIVDYLDLLESDRHFGEPRFELDYITQCLRGWAQEENIPLWTATQFNRSAYNNENPDGSAIGEAFSKLFTVDACLIMAQTLAELEEERMRIKVEKNRNGPSGKFVEIDTDYSTMTFVRNQWKKEAEAENANYSGV